MPFLPSLDSTSKSHHQLLKTKGHTRLAIINIFNDISLNHSAMLNRKAEIGNKDGHPRSPGIKKGFEVDLSQLNYIKYIGLWLDLWLRRDADVLKGCSRDEVNSSPELSHNILFALL